ncbi:MAG: AbrB/MazE/SpoVT family DNA-binding domain-containing protein [Patescibacteria group bacterium]
MQEFKTTSSKKGQITIPAPIRKHLGINRGTIIYFKIINSTMVGMPKKEYNILKLGGFLKDKDDSKSYKKILESSYEKSIKSRLKL